MIHSIEAIPYRGSALAECKPRLGGSFLGGMLMAVSLAVVQPSWAQTSLANPAGGSLLLDGGAAAQSSAASGSGVRGSGLLNPPSSRDIRRDGGRRGYRGDRNRALDETLADDSAQRERLSPEQRASLRAQGLDGAAVTNRVYDARILDTPDNPDLRAFERNDLNTREKALYRDGAFDRTNAEYRRDVENDRLDDQQFYGARGGVRNRGFRYGAQGVNNVSGNSATTSSATSSSTTTSTTNSSVTGQ